MPLSDPALAEYLSELFETGKAPVVAAVKFRAITKGGKVWSGLSARSIRTIIARRAKAAGVPGRVRFPLIRAVVRLRSEH